MNEPQLKEIRNYISKLVSINAGKGAKTPLCPHRMEELEGKLLIKAVKAAKRYISALSPLIPFIKGMLKIEAAREAARLFSKQIKKGETTMGEIPLDAVVSQDDDGSYIDNLEESPEVIRKRQLCNDVREVLSHLSRRERIALKPLMYVYITKEYTAKRLKISRPTLDNYLKRKVIPHFIEIWNELGKSFY